MFCRHASPIGLTIYQLFNQLVAQNIAQIPKYTANELLDVFYSNKKFFMCESGKHKFIKRSYKITFFVLEPIVHSRGLWLQYRAYLFQKLLSKYKISALSKFAKDLAFEELDVNNKKYTYLNVFYVNYIPDIPIKNQIISSLKGGVFI